MIVLEDSYRDACADIESDIFEHLPYLRALVTGRQARTVIELGTRGGNSTLAWLIGVEETDGHVWSVDLDPPPPLKHPRWTFLQGNDLAPEIFTALPEADIVFIDTSHTYRQTLAELHAYRWKVRPGGLLVLHDTELPRPLGVGPVERRYPVRCAIEDFCAEERLSWSNRQNCWGLGTIEIPEE